LFLFGALYHIFLGVRSVIFDFFYRP